MKYVNLTPHVVRLNSGLEIAPSGSVARCATSYSADRWISDGPDGVVTLDDEFYDGAVPIYRASFGQVVGLPEPEAGTLYIVSGMVASATPDRQDVVAPATGHPEAVRRDGQVWSVPGFSK
jgi:hypothetical protein